MQPQTQEEDQEEPWIQIPTKSKRHRNKQSQQPTLLTPKNPPLKDYTLPTLTVNFNLKLKIWHQSTCRKTTLSLLNRIRPEAGWNLSKAICLGCGSLSRENWECRRRSLWQFVVFYDLARFLLDGGDEEEEGGRRMYAQEPTFTSLDTDFLSTLNVAVLSSSFKDEGMGPAGKLLDPQTFLFEPFVDMNEGMLECMLKGDAGLCIGSSIQGILGRRGESVLEKLAGEFAEGREMRRFPGFEVERNVLEGLGIWWREEGEEDE